MDEIMMKSFGCFVFVRERKYIIINMLTSDGKERISMFDKVEV